MTNSIKKTCLRKGLLVIVAAVLSIVLAAPVQVLGSEYDPTDPRDYNVTEQETTATEPPSGEEISETTTETITESTSKAAMETTTQTTATTVPVTTEIRVLLPTRAQHNPVYNGKNATRIPIITYHRVVSAKEKKNKKIKKNSLFISVTVFNKQMRWLHKHKYRTISTQEFYDWYTGKTEVPEKSVVVTFDDGYYGTYYLAYPIIKKYDQAATVFCIGHHIEAVTPEWDPDDREDHHIGADLIEGMREEYPKFAFESHINS